MIGKQVCQVEIKIDVGCQGMLVGGASFYFSQQMRYGVLKP